MTIVNCWLAQGSSRFCIAWRSYPTDWVRSHLLFNHLVLPTRVNVWKLRTRLQQKPLYGSAGYWAGRGRQLVLVVMYMLGSFWFSQICISHLFRFQHIIHYHDRASDEIDLWEFATSFSLAARSRRWMATDLILKSMSKSRYSWLRRLFCIGVFAFQLTCGSTQWFSHKAPVPLLMHTAVSFAKTS